MFAPKLYTVHKFQFLDLVRLGMEVNGDLKFYEIKQQDNMLFRQIKAIALKVMYSLWTVLAHSPSLKLLLT